LRTLVNFVPPRTWDGRGQVMGEQRHVTAAATIFQHARWRVVIMGAAGVGLGSLTLSKLWEKLDRAGHTDDALAHYAC
jgi:hypothetical protein